MIHQEEIEIGGKTFLRTASDEFYIRQAETGYTYEEAIDVLPCPYTYEETEEPLPEPEPPEPENE